MTARTEAVCLNRSGVQVLDKSPWPRLSQFATGHRGLPGGVIHARSTVGNPTVDGALLTLFVPTKAAHLSQSTVARVLGPLVSVGMAALGDLLGLLDHDPARRGRQFERICRWFLTHDPVYARELRSVWARCWAAISITPAQISAA